MICKHCKEEVGVQYSELDTHMWTKHRQIMMRFLDKQRDLKLEAQKRETE